MKPASESSAVLSPDRKMQADIRAEQMSMLLKNTRSVCFFATLFAGVLAVYLHQHMDVHLVYWWLGIKVVVVIPRMAHAWWLESRDQPYARQDFFWALMFIFLDGLWWGMSWPLFLPYLDQQTITMLSCAMIGIVSVAAFTLHVYAMSLLLYCVPIVLPGCLMLLWRQDAFGWFMGVGGMLFLFGLISVARRTNSHVKEMLWRRFSMDRIIGEKEDALAEAARQDSIKSQFVATMSHELRTPLHGILGLTKMLRDEHTNDSSTQHQLGMIERTGEHLLMLINRVLDFSRIEAGYLTLDEKPFILHNLLSDIIHLTAITAQSKGLRITHRLDIPNEMWVEGDAPKFKQILLNLIGNAIKFTEVGTVHIDASHDASNGLTTIHVQDSGIGIPLKDIPTIFEPYKQARTVAGGPTGGTGLGLTISREISRAMQGDITCESQEGVGSTFTLKAILPEWQPDADTDFAALSAENGATVSLNDNEVIQLNGHVLLAEDNEVNALIVDLQLQRKGLTVEHVKNGQEALERLLRTDQKRPDVVLMDCQMPLVDGFEATQKLRAYEHQHRLARLPVIALTASAMAEDSRRCLNSGMDAHLSKPFNEDQLIALLLRYLSPLQPAYH